MKKILVSVALVLATFGIVSSASASSHPSYLLGKAKHCRANYRSVVRSKHVHGKVVHYRECIWQAPKLGVTAPTSTTTTTTLPPATTTAILPSSATGGGASGQTVVTASIDPSYALPDTPQAPPLPVTFTYSASDMGASTLPDGELTLTVYVHASVNLAGGCETNVSDADSSTDSATCILTLPAWGLYDLLVSYSSGVSNVATTGQTDTIDVEPPALSPETVVEQWGGATVSANVTGTSAAVVVTDAYWEGAASLGLTDQLGDACTAYVSDTTATCIMIVTGTPSSFTLAYPGGDSTTVTQTISPWGVPESQTVTYEWPADSVLVSNPTVTTQFATVEWISYRVLGVTGKLSVDGPINLTSGQTLMVDAYAQGSISSDIDALGELDFVISPSGSYTEYDVNTEADNCSAGINEAGEASDGCEISFTGPGVYSLQVNYLSGDPNYGSADGPMVTVNVGS